jgi:hypothetical protein
MCGHVVTERKTGNNLKISKLATQDSTARPVDCGIVHMTL